jgi:hypothetical protein
MALKNIKNYGELQTFWRYEMKQALPQGRQVIFWRNDAENLTTSANDIIHFWGAQADVAKGTTLSDINSIGKLNLESNPLPLRLPVHKQGNRQHLVQRFGRFLLNLEANLPKLQHFPFRNREVTCPGCISDVVGGSVQ